jgi:hypothetical protein
MSALLAVGDVFWGSGFSSIGLIVVALISKANVNTKVRLKSIDEAVNHKETGMPTLVQRVIDQDDRGVQMAQELANFREWVQDTFIAFGKAQGVELRPMLKKVDPTNVQLPKDSEHPQPNPFLNKQQVPEQSPEPGDRDSVTGATHAE